MHSIAKKIYHKSKKARKNISKYLEIVNNRLLKDYVIQRPLLLNELISIVDFHSFTAGGFHHKEREIDIN